MAMAFTGQRAFKHWYGLSSFDPAVEPDDVSSKFVRQDEPLDLLERPNELRDGKL